MSVMWLVSPCVVAVTVSNMPHCEDYPSYAAAATTAAHSKTVAGVPAPSRHASHLSANVALPALPRDPLMINGAVSPTQPWMDVKILSAKSKFAVWTRGRGNLLLVYTDVMTRRQ